MFFDIGGTLATAKMEGSPPELAGLDLLPDARAMLEAMSRAGRRQGIISNTGDVPGNVITSYLEDAGIRSFFDPQLLIYSKDVGLTKPSLEIFKLSVERAGLADEPGSCLFVGEDAAERGAAKDAGMQALAPPSLLPSTR